MLPKLCRVRACSIGGVLVGPPVGIIKVALAHVTRLTKNLKIAFIKLQFWEFAARLDVVYVERPICALAKRASFSVFLQSRISENTPFLGFVKFIAIP